MLLRTGSFLIQFSGVKFHTKIRSLPTSYSDKEQNVKVVKRDTPP